MKHSLPIIGAVLLTTALWFTACSNSLLDKPEAAQNSGGAGGETGVGTVAIRIETPEERTLYPALTFTKHVLSFSGPGSAAHGDEVITD
jgi:hypothetical protein